MSRAARMMEINRNMATLALSRMMQGGQLSIRQREQLRRAFAAAGEELDWATMMVSVDEPMEKALKDLLNLAQKGTKALEEDLAQDLVNKKAEINVLKKVAKGLHQSAENHDFSEQLEAQYFHTARDGSSGYTTKTVNIVMANVKETTAAAEGIEKKLESWNKLREAMLVDLKAHKKRLAELKGTLAEFVEGSRGLLREVFQTLT